MEGQPLARILNERDSLNGAGFPSQPATSPSGEEGTIHTVPTANAPVDLRTMDGGTHINREP